MDTGLLFLAKLLSLAVASCHLNWSENFCCSCVSLIWMFIGFLSYGFCFALVDKSFDLWSIWHLNRSMSFRLVSRSSLYFCYLKVHWVFRNLILFCSFWPKLWSFWYCYLNWSRSFCLSRFGRRTRVSAVWTFIGFSRISSLRTCGLKHAMTFYGYKSFQI